MFAISLVEYLDTAEEVTQVVFVKVINHHKDLSGIQNLRDYLYHATRNTSINFLKTSNKSSTKINFISNKTSSYWNL